MTTLTTSWGSHPVTLTWTPASVPPEEFTVTSTHGFCFHEGKVVMVNLESRGWDIPGGHMENDETPAECFAREAMEEACIVGTSSMIGYILVDNRNDPTHDPSKYPEIGCQIYYRMDVDVVLPFIQEFEASERGMFPAEEVPFRHGNWNIINQAILEEAVSTVS